MQQPILNTHHHLQTHITSRCKREGAIDFATFMETVLYHPEWGYYCNAKQKIGAKGDYVTAPSLTPLFSQTIAKQCHDVQTNFDHAMDILELGAGLGHLAVECMMALIHHYQPPRHYYILEISPTLIQQQKNRIRAYCPEYFNKFIWINSLSELPPLFKGIIIGNEFLDALPVQLFQISENDNPRIGHVTVRNTDLSLTFLEKSDPNCLQCIQNELSQLPEPLPIGYVSEILVTANSWLQRLYQILHQGVLILIDYGFTRNEYYHPERNQGTLMCHRKHTAHADPLGYLGEQDLTAHVNFSQLHQAANQCGFDTLGFTNQATFLLNLGILELATSSNSTHLLQQSPLLQTLLQPHEMGELFKVIAFGKNYPHPLAGFSSRDHQHKL